MANFTVLDLDDLTELPSVKIDGKLHPLRSFGMLAPMELHRLQRMFARYDLIVAKSDTGEAEDQELADLPDKMCRMVLMAPDAVHQVMTDWHRMRVINAFFDLPLRAGARGPGAESALGAGATPSTIGAPSSPALSASTEATP